MNILVVRNDKLGDFITALPTCKVLKEYDHDNKITVLVAPLNEELAKACDFIDEVIVDRGESALKLAKRLRKYRFDVSLTLFSNTRVALAQFIAGIPKRIAPATKIAQIFYNHRVKQRRSQVKMAEFEYNLQLAKALYHDISLEYQKPLCRFDDAQEVYAKFCKEYAVSKDVIAFHPGFGGSSDANFSPEEYVQMIESVLEGAKHDVVLTFGPDEAELMAKMELLLQDTLQRYACTEKIGIKVDTQKIPHPFFYQSNCGKKVVFYISKEGIVHFAKVISGFRLFVSTSTGTYHLASLVGTPTLTFFADTLFASSKRWKSVGDEKLQKHYMLPEDEEKRREILEEVKKELKAF